MTAPSDAGDRPPQTPRKKRAPLAGPRRVVRWTVRAVIAIIVYAAVIALTMPDAALWIIPSWREIMARFQTIPPPPLEWARLAKSNDRLDIKGVDVAYWGKPDAPYGARVTRVAKTPVAVIIHFTHDAPAVSMVEYGHRADPFRGNNAFGYHVYVDAAGRVFQGAPLGVRTNHIKPSHASERISGLKHLDSANTIGVSLVGGCRVGWFSTGLYNCARETVTQAQLAAGAAVVASLQARFGISCRAVFGHGEVQTDRKTFEGLTLATYVRERC